MTADIRLADRRPEPAPVANAATSRGAAFRSTRLRLIALGDGYDAAYGNDPRSGREYHPYGLMVWDGFA